MMGLAPSSATVPPSVTDEDVKGTTVGLVTCGMPKVKYIFSV